MAAGCLVPCDEAERVWVGGVEVEGVEEGVAECADEEVHGARKGSYRGEEAETWKRNERPRVREEPRNPI